MVPHAVPRMILLMAAVASASRSFVRLELAGIGQYGAAPALFLEQQRGGKVLPVPIPRQSALACEQALSPGSPAMADVLLCSRLFASRNNGLIDQLPWQWNPSELAKRDGVARLSGRDYPQGARRYESPYHLLLDVVRKDARAEPSRVEIVAEPDFESDGIVISAQLLLVKRLPPSQERANPNPNPNTDTNPDPDPNLTLNLTLTLTLALARSAAPRARCGRVTRGSSSARRTSSTKNPNPNPGRTLTLTLEEP
jgi:hypothetical protein